MAGNDKIAGFLDQLGLGEYAPAFHKNAVNLELMSDLTDADLRELGVTKVGHRRKLLRAITQILETNTIVEPPSFEVAADATRRHMTVLFCDLVGSTSLSTRLDPEDMSALLGRYHSTCDALIGLFGGHVAQHMGDGVLAYFGYPRASEDQAVQAVRAGLAMTKDVAALSSPDGQPLAARVGIATGIVVVAEGGGIESQWAQSVVGEIPNLAARLQSIAPPGGVAISSGTRELLGGIFDLCDLGPQALKGFESAPLAYRVDSEREILSRFNARITPVPPIVARDQETALIAERWQQAAAGEGQGIVLTGEAGIGKSRICQALIDKIKMEPHHLAVFQCSPHHSDSALWPVVRQLEQTMKFVEQDSKSERIAKLEGFLAAYAAVTNECALLLARLLGVGVTESDAGVSPSLRRTQTLEALVVLLKAIAAERPVLLVFEDIHWADPTTLELIGRCLSEIPATAVLMVVTSRSDNHRDLTMIPHVTQLHLNRLGRIGSEQIAHQHGGDVLQPEIVAKIVAKTDGIPLFIEELTKTAVALGKPALPNSLHDTLLARLDRIPEAKLIAQVAACLGREFHRELLARVLGLDPAMLEIALGELERAEILLPDRTGSLSIFKHALVRDAAYESLLRADRRDWHARIAVVLENDHAAADHPEWLAHHHELANNIEHAIHYWQAAGNLERDRSAVHEAAAHYARAIALAKVRGEPTALQDKLRLIELHTELGAQLIAIKGNGAEQVVETYRTIYALCDGMPNSAAMIRALHGMRTHYLVRGPIERAHELGERILSITEELDDPDLSIQANRAHGLCLFAMGQFAEGLNLMSLAASIYSKKQHSPKQYHYTSDPLVLTKCHMGWCHVFLGDEAAAVREADDAVALARKLRHAHSEAFAVSLQASVYAALGNAEAVMDQTAGLVALADANSFPYWHAWGRALGGWAAAFSSGDRGGLIEMENAIGEYAETGATMMIGYFEALRAEASLYLGDVEQAVAAIEAASHQVNTNGVRFYEAEICRIRALAGQASTKRDRLQAARILESAAAIAEHQRNHWALVRIAAAEQALIQ